MARKTTGMCGGVRRQANIGAFRSPLIDEISSRDSRHQVADLSSTAPALESDMWICFGSFPPVPLFPAVEKNFGSANRFPRKIFGPTPTQDEAKEKCSSLKGSIEKVSYQPNPKLDSREDCQRSVGETRTAYKQPKHISQMFSLLHQSSEVQDVVSSIAKDECVFEAVMKNEMVAEFLKNVPPNVDSAKSISVNECPKESYSPESQKSCKGSMFSNMVNNVSGETRTVSKLPKHISQMFSLLHRSSEVQDVVASIATDECVFEAVMKNEMVAEFMKNVPPTKFVSVNESPEESHPIPESEKTYKGSMFSNMVNNVKVKVSEKASNISDFLHDFLAKSSGNSGSQGAMPTFSTAEALHPDKTSFFALAVAAILIVFLMS
ncbi:hypothetical protein MA16_Dca014491 [Dendrobium catenatum]|uniref:Uncharacterized protein n=1 Tax=Dendrobium catenatum TaxID=906689 RepID=A0A2I0W311_9ASPA|nr:hypothetical protein MA16_Dca014491 [Dendrobium catenatum]